MSEFMYQNIVDLLPALIALPLLATLTQQQWFSFFSAAGFILIVPIIGIIAFFGTRIAHSHGSFGMAIWMGICGVAFCLPPLFMRKKNASDYTIGGVLIAMMPLILLLDFVF